MKRPKGVQSFPHLVSIYILAKQTLIELDAALELRAFRQRLRRNYTADGC